MPKVCATRGEAEHDGGQIGEVADHQAERHEQRRAEAGAERARDQRGDAGAGNGGGERERAAIGKEAGEGHGTGNIRKDWDGHLADVATALTPIDFIVA